MAGDAPAYVVEGRSVELFLNSRGKDVVRGSFFVIFAEEMPVAGCYF